jgi:bifunctional non-homologous end joining protein LigD
MPRVVKRPASRAAKSGPSRRGATPSAVRPSGTFPTRRSACFWPQWVHEIKLDGFRMAARLDDGRVQLLTRTGLDWTAKYRRAIALQNRT